MMVHHMLSVVRRATPPSGASLMPAAASENAEGAQPAPSPSAAPMSIYRPAPVAAAPVTVSNAGAQVALPTALAAYLEFAE